MAYPGHSTYVLAPSRERLWAADQPQGRPTRMLLSSIQQVDASLTSLTQASLLLRTSLDPITSSSFHSQLTREVVYPAFSRTEADGSSMPNRMYDVNSRAAYELVRSMQGVALGRPAGDDVVR